MVAFMSDAGMPLISDPGFRLVRASREAGLPVTVIPGANAALTALAGAGIPAEPFHFAGFLPAKSAARQKAIAAFASVPGTLVVHETAPRLAASLADLAAGLGASRQASVARELTKLFEEWRSGTLGELAEYYQANEARGEIVIVIGPAGEQAIAIDSDALLREALRTHSLRDAVAAVSGATGLKKSDVYARALKLAKET